MTKLKKVKNRNEKKSILKKTYPFLNIVSRLPKKSRDTVLKATNGDKDIFQSIREIALNTQLGNLKLNKHLLHKHMPYIRKITNIKTNQCTCGKRKKLIQKGSGFLAAAIPILATIAYEIFKK